MTPASGELPSKITIGYQNVPNGDLVVKHDRLLEQAFGDSVTIDWKLFDSGGSVNEAVLAVASTSASSVPAPPREDLLGIAYQVPWIFDVIGKAEALVVKGDSGIASLADLKGKTIATPFASTSHYSLLAALQDAGVAESDVKIIDAEPDAIFAAWSRGDIDGAYVWNPNLAKLVADNGKVLITSETLRRRARPPTTSRSSPAISPPSTRQQCRCGSNSRARQWRRSRAIPTQRLRRLQPSSTSPQEAKQQISELIFLDAGEQIGSDYLGGGLATNLYAAANFNKDLGKIEDVKPEDAYQQAVVPTFAAEVK